MVGPMRVLFVSAEIYPFAKTGGLADVSAALPAALRDRGVDMRVLMPGYRHALERAPSPREVLHLRDPLGYGDTRLLETHLPHSNVSVWLIDCPNLYDRAGGPYSDEDGRGWADNHLRFALLSHIAAAIASEPGASWQPDIVHANDWHAALVPMLLGAQGRQGPPTVLTIHNLAYQGVFEPEAFARLGLDPSAYFDMEFYGRISFLKGGILPADAITTVSPTYAKEILTPEYGCGLDGVLREKDSQVVGILNGVDYDIWDPSCDPFLAGNYTARSVGSKAVNKAAIQAELGLDVAPDRVLLAFMSRLVHQKTPDLVLEALPEFIEDGMQFGLVAEGDNNYEQRFRELAARYPGRVAVQIGYREASAHRLLAGADILLHPSRFEPCGLVPIYAMRYGTIPVVRNSGGMADSVIDATPQAILHDTGTGFSFAAPAVKSLVESVRRAHSLYQQPLPWRKVQRCAMQQDFGWGRSADAYMNLYRSLARVPAAAHVAEDKMTRKAERVGIR
jgi:starch synthase